MTRHPFRHGGLLGVVLLLGACNTANFDLGTEANRIGPPPPLGTPRVDKPVDGMIVGDRLMAAGEYVLALAAYERAAAEDGISAEVLSAMGTANLKLGRVNQARELLEKAVAADERSVPAWNNLGVVLIDLHEYHQAREAFRVAFGIDNGDSELIRQNLILVNKLIAQELAKIPETGDFSLVRHGNGSYFLVGN